MSREGAGRYQPSWDRLGAFELDYTGVVAQPGLLAATIRQALSESERGIPVWGARAMARHLANQMGARPSALHHFAITGEGCVGDLMDEVTDLVSAPRCTEQVRVCADGLADFIHQELHRLGLCPPDDEAHGGTS